MSHTGAEKYKSETYSKQENKNKQKENTVQSCFANNLLKVMFKDNPIGEETIHIPLQSL